MISIGLILFCLPNKSYGLRNSGAKCPADEKQCKKNSDCEDGDTCENGCCTYNPEAPYAPSDNSSLEVIQNTLSAKSDGLTIRDTENDPSEEEIEPVTTFYQYLTTTFQKSNVTVTSPTIKQKASVLDAPTTGDGDADSDSGDGDGDGDFLQGMVGDVGGTLQDPQKTGYQTITVTVTSQESIPKLANIYTENLALKVPLGITRNQHCAAMYQEFKAAYDDAQTQEKPPRCTLVDYIGNELSYFDCYAATDTGKIGNLVLDFMADMTYTDSNHPHASIHYRECVHGTQELSNGCYNPINVYPEVIRPVVEEHQVDGWTDANIIDPSLDINQEGNLFYTAYSGLGDRPGMFLWRGKEGHTIAARVLTGYPCAKEMADDFYSMVCFQKNLQKFIDVCAEN